jgi:HlyD family secretion protein
MNKKKKIWSLLGLSCSVILILGFTFGRNGDNAEDYTWDAVSRGEVRETLQASGECQARARVNIGTSAAGAITGIFVKDGEEVLPNQLLLTIDQVRLQQQLAQAVAALDASRRDADRLRSAMDRARERFRTNETLFRQGLLPDSDYRQSRVDREAAEFSYQSAAANIAQNEANVAAMRDALDKTVIRAPIAGRVTAMKAEKGEMAIPGMSNLPGAVLMVISDTRDMIAEMKVSESEVVRVKTGQAAQVSLESLSGHVFRGRVYEIASAAEQSAQESNMYKVKIALDAADPEFRLLRPGMTARGVILTADVNNAVRVPLQAVLERESSIDEAKAKGLLAPETRSVVMVVRDGHVHEQEVVTGIADTQFYQVLSGLAVGDKVITGPVRKLRDLKNHAVVSLRKKSDSALEREEARKS